MDMLTRTLDRWVNDKEFVDAIQMRIGLTALIGRAPCHGDCPEGECDCEHSYFGTGACQSCGTTRGGMRTDVVLVERDRRSDGKVYGETLSICQDCEAFHANGTLPSES